MGGEKRSCCFFLKTGRFFLQIRGKCGTLKKPCRCDGIGRRSGLKIHRQRWRAGSTPASGTKQGTRHWPRALLVFLLLLPRPGRRNRDAIGPRPTIAVPPPAMRAGLRPLASGTKQGTRHWPRALLVFLLLLPRPGLRNRDAIGPRPTIAVPPPAVRAGLRPRPAAPSQINPNQMLVTSTWFGFPFH